MDKTSFRRRKTVPHENIISALILFMLCGLLGCSNQSSIDLSTAQKYVKSNQEVFAANQYYITNFYGSRTIDSNALVVEIIAPVKADLKSLWGASLIIVFSDPTTESLVSSYLRNEAHETADHYSPGKWITSFDPERILIFKPTDNPQKMALTKLKAKSLKIIPCKDERRSSRALNFSW